MARGRVVGMTCIAPVLGSGVDGRCIDHVAQGSVLLVGPVEDEGPKFQNGQI